MIETKLSDVGNNWFEIPKIVDCHSNSIYDHFAVFLQLRRVVKIFCILKREQFNGLWSNLKDVLEQDNSNLLSTKLFNLGPCFLNKFDCFFRKTSDLLWLDFFVIKESKLVVLFRLLLFNRLTDVGELFEVLVVLVVELLFFWSHLLCGSKRLVHGNIIEVCTTSFDRLLGSNFGRIRSILSFFSISVLDN